ncbi:NUP192 [Candida pseudojiufengensis]|uniref:NUP192 n=1 Tax=Candida pseudojiufengensis TaxID=497109 RepID=UPI00222449B6|nr:NUP192 [Candida pseudojiufengensis]KAI5963463.1 NUP192 [Candida pseudojiufengensis]
MSYQWNVEVFAEIYNALKFQPNVDISTINFDPISNDLLQVLKTSQPKNSRIKLDSTIKFQNGDEVLLNEAFIELSGILSIELDLGEVDTAELLFFSEDVSFKKGTSLKDSAKLSYFTRFEYILNILGYLITNHELTHDPITIFNNSIESFDKINKLINILNDLIDKQKVTGDIDNLEFINGINYARIQLFKCHELLGLVLYGLSDQYFEKIGTVQNYEKVIKIVKTLSNDDILIIHFLPFVLNFYEKSKNSKVIEELYTSITKSIPKDSKSETFDLSKSQLHGFEIVVNFIFLTEFIPWCKKNKDSSSKKYDFQNDIIKYMEQFIGIGVMEILLNYCAETSTPKTQQIFELSETYDFRSLLQKTIPKLIPSKFIYPGTEELKHLEKQRYGISNIPKLIDVSFLSLNPELNNSLISPYFQNFFSTFISNAAIILTSLRDSEEDFALSFGDKNEEINEENNDSEESLKNNNEPISEFDEIAQRADLERFYLAFAYTFNDRPESCSNFWSDESINNEVLGFLSWALNNNTSPLIVACFCVLLASLTSGGSTFATNIWDFLISSSHNLKKNDFSKITIDSIYESLKYYIDSLISNFEIDLNDQLSVHQKKHELVFANKSLDIEDNGQDKIIIELAEDSIVSISGFIHLISSLMKNLSDSTRAKEIKNIAYQRFIPLIKNFFEFDNLITGGNILQVDLNSNNSSTSTHYVNLPQIHVSDDSRSLLINLMFRLLGNFVDEDSYIRYEIWRLIDSWMYHGLHINSIQQNDLFGKPSDKRKYIRKKPLGTIEVFSNNLTHYSEVFNFIDLIKSLLEPLGSGSAFDKYTLSFPCDLGFGYRPNNQLGIGAYIEFILVDVFSKSQYLTNEDDRIALQNLILEFCIDSLTEINWKFLSEISLKVIRNFNNFENIFDSLIPGCSIDYENFVKLHHSLAIITYFFDNKANNSLFEIINYGVDTINSSHKKANLVFKALNTFDLLLDIQGTYKTTLLPILKSKNIAQQPIHRNSISGINTSMNLILAQPTTIFDNIYQSKLLRSQGVNSFFDVFLFRISSIVHIALFVSCDNEISKFSLKILSKITNSNHFKSTKTKADPLINNDRILTTFLNIDESEKIKFAFIDKFEEVEDNFDIKYQILKLISSTLGKNISVGHFLLGYEIKANTLYLNNDDHNTLLKVLLNTLDISLNLITELDYGNGNRHVIDVGPAKLSSLILEVIIKICTNPVSSYITMTAIRNHNNLIENLINFQPRLDLLTIWCGHEFNGDLSINSENHFITSLPSIEAFISFINQRELALKLIALEYYSTSSITRKQYFTKLLIDNKNQIPHQSSKILDFLDVLNFNFKNFEIEKYDYLNQSFNMNLILQLVSNDPIDYSILKDIFKILCQSSNLITTESKQHFTDEIMIEGNKIHEFVTKYLVLNKTRKVQLQFLISWCQLIEILVVEDDSISNEFIVEILNSILPKISSYLDSDITFSEELVSLCGTLFDIYCEHVSNKEDIELIFDQLLPLFQTCVSAVINSSSTPTLRSEIYLILNKLIFKNESLSYRIFKLVKSSNKKLFPVLANDALYSEDLSRINSVFLLDSLIKVGNNLKTDYILDNMIKTNLISQLIRSIRRTDEILKIASINVPQPEYSLNNIFIELTSFKANLYLLNKIAQSQIGSLNLIQNEIFQIFKNLNLLKIDPDLGLTLYLNEIENFKKFNIILYLNTPLSLVDLINQKNNTKDNNNTFKNQNSISFNELIIPIFELIVTILLSMGQNYKPSINQSKEFMKKIEPLVDSVLKREYLLSCDNEIKNDLSKEKSGNNANEIVLLSKLVDLFTIIHSLTE